MQEQIEGFSLSPLQHHLVRLDGGFADAQRVATARVRVRGPVQPDALAAALTEVARRNEILRTAFTTLPGTEALVQTIRADASVALDVHPNEAGSAQELDALEAELAARPFDLAAGEVLRATLVGTNGDHHLLLAQPPLAADATSLWNLVRATAAVLRGEDAAGEEDGAMQYADIAQWLHDNLESEEAAPGLAHWRSVTSEREAFALPLVFDRGEDAPHELAVVTRAWAASDTEAIERVAASCGASAEAVLAAAWSGFLARLAERDELLIAIHSKGRSYEGLGEALGPFGRWLPVEADVHADTIFSSLVRTTHAALSRAQEWHEVFDRERAGITAELPAHALAFHDRVQPEAAGELSFELERRRCLAEPARLALELDLAAASPELGLRFDRRSLDDASARVLLDQLGVFLDDACGRSEASIGSLALASPTERDRVLELSRGPEVAPRTAAVIDLIAEQARRTPDAIAVQADDEEVTYAELDRRAARLAAHLARIGVEPGDFVGLFVGRCVEQLVAILGTMKAGAAYLPLPPGYPGERLAFMLADTGAGVVLTRGCERDQLPEFDGEVVELDGETPLDGGGDVPESIALDGPAYVIYTSGSTGKPKGVVISHANLAHSTVTRLEHYEDPVGAYLLLPSFAFDSSVPGIFWTLCQGGRLVLPEDGFEQEIPAIASLIQARGITHILCLPSLYGLILDSAQPEELDSLRTMIVAGESCPPELVRTHHLRLAGTRLFNEYGPTEGTVWCTVHDTAAGPERPVVPIGRPIPGVRTVVVDAGGEPAPLGVAGELWIGGAGIATGYLARPELTAERFVEPTFAPGERFYRTGDLVRLLPGGELEFLGRIDHQVKLRGYRIELEEIEAVLAEQEGVRECVVIAREDTPGDLRLVAYVQPRGEDVTAAALRGALSAPLPEYMVPAHFVFLSDFPLLPNGKVDRRALPAPGGDRAGASAAYEEPATPLERVLVAIWSDVLQVDRVGANDDFFELGGHSILATKLFARMVDLLQTKVALRAIFDHRTPRALAAEILSDADESERIARAAEVIVEVLDEDAADAAG
jgi:amino acid adenylation domain-containing protein